jgi:hypothetical protein
MDHLMSAENLAAAEGVSDGVLLDEVHLTAQHLFNSPRMARTSQRLQGASWSKVTSTSTSLSGEKSSRRTEPKSASS